MCDQELLKQHPSLTSRSTLSFVSPAMLISWATLGASGVETLRGGGSPNSSVMVVWFTSVTARRLRRFLVGWSSAIMLGRRRGGSGSHDFVSYTHTPLNTLPPHTLTPSPTHPHTHILDNTYGRRVDSQNEGQIVNELSHVEEVINTDS